MSVTCRVCGSLTDKLVHSDIPATVENPKTKKFGWNWYECIYCQSHTSDQPDPDVKTVYSDDYPFNHFAEKNWEVLVEQYNTNMDYFDRYLNPSNTFALMLEVGCCEHCGIQAALNRGYKAFGWDLMLGYTPKHPQRVKVSPSFHWNCWGVQFDGVLSRETIEHVADWQNLLENMIQALHLGGFLQVQTPRPTVTENSIGYQQDHLVLFSPGALIAQLECRGMKVLEAKYWDEGQLVMAQKK